MRAFFFDSSATGFTTKNTRLEGFNFHHFWLLVSVGNEAPVPSPVCRAASGSVHGARENAARTSLRDLKINNKRTAETSIVATVHGMGILRCNVLNKKTRAPCLSLSDREEPLQKWCFMVAHCLTVKRRVSDVGMSNCRLPDEGTRRPCFCKPQLRIK